jgi:hypothetical protein
MPAGISESCLRRWMELVRLSREKRGLVDGPAARTPNTGRPGTRNRPTAKAQRQGREIPPHPGRRMGKRAATPHSVVNHPPAVYLTSGQYT